MAAIHGNSFNFILGFSSEIKYWVHDRYWTIQAPTALTRRSVRKVRLFVFWSDVNKYLDTLQSIILKCTRTFYLQRILQYLHIHDAKYLVPDNEIQVSSLKQIVSFKTILHYLSQICKTLFVFTRYLFTKSFVVFIFGGVLFLEPTRKDKSGPSRRYRAFLEPLSLFFSTTQYKRNAKQVHKSRIPRY